MKKEILFICKKDSVFLWYSAFYEAVKNNSKTLDIKMFKKTIHLSLKKFNDQKELYIQKKLFININPETKIIQLIVSVDNKKELDQVIGSYNRAERWIAYLNRNIIEIKVQDVS